MNIKICSMRAAKSDKDSVRPTDRSPDGGVEKWRRFGAQFGEPYERTI